MDPQLVELTVEGRPALVAFMRSVEDGTFVDPSEAGFVIVNFTDEEGGIHYLFPEQQ